MTEQKRVKTLTGKVISNKMDKTIVVAIERQVTHRLYKKSVKLTTKVHAYDEDNTCEIGDIVKIVETRPKSKTKAWALAEVVERITA